MTPAPRTYTPPPSAHSLTHRLMRFLWGIVYVLVFRTSPRNLHGWRNLLLRLFGASLHPTARVYPRARVWAPWNLTMKRNAGIADDVDVYAVDRIEIGERTVVSQYCYLCGASHDFNVEGRPLTPAPIVLGDDVWLAADVFVAPGVSIGDRSVVGARSSVFRDLPSDKVCFGTPAKPVRDRTPPMSSGESVGDDA